VGLVNNVAALARAWPTSFACRWVNSTLEFINFELNNLLQAEITRPNSITYGRGWLKASAIIWRIYQSFGAIELKSILHRHTQRGYGGNLCVPTSSERDHRKEFLFNTNFSPRQAPYTDSSSFATCISKVSFPRFDGSKLKELLYKWSQFFSIGETSNEMKVHFAAIYLDDGAFNGT